MTDTALVWFRRDLRRHDNPALVAAATADRVVPVYVWDPRRYGTAEYGGRESFAYRKTGSHRTAFRREAVTDLRAALREQGSELVVRRGEPARELAAVAETVDADRVHFATYPTAEERTVARAVVDRLADRGVVAHGTCSHTLFHPADLPTPVTEIDDTFTSFRKQAAESTPVREPLSVPTLPPAGTVDAGTVPSLSSLNVAPPTDDGRAVLAFRGGESAGRERLREYVWERDRLRTYKATRNGLLGPDYSSKLSPWLNEGCLSPRTVHAAVRRYEETRVENKSTYWLRFELFWRDFFQFQFVKHGSRLFAPGGIRERDDKEWRRDEDAFSRWAAGETGVPFVDANMRELRRTGYMSNRGRQNAASFLANTLGIDWRRGAAHFETHLVDYDPCSNYGNWAYIAGVGNDSRDRAFDVLWQAHRYDSDAEYVKTWLPVLEPLPPELAHEPWTMTPSEKAEYGVVLGRDYPEPMVEIES
jgi:deoxyribodipyrimidine photo-lyase